MKKLLRIIIFSGLALYLTALWNKGFIIPTNPYAFLKLAALIILIKYLVIPLSKIILLPINFLTLGLASFLVFVLALHLMKSNSLLIIKPWIFPGIHLYLLSIPKTIINYPSNLILSSLSISSIINILELLL